MWRVYSIHNWTFILHRLTGTALLVYFVAHVLAISTALLAGPDAFTSVMATFRKPGFRLLEVAILGCIAFHALNGVQMIAAERGWLRPGARKTFSAATVGAAVTIWLVAAAVSIVF